MVAKVGNFLFIGGVRGISGFFFRSLGEKLFLCLGRSPMVVIFLRGWGVWHASCLGGVSRWLARTCG